MYAIIGLIGGLIVVSLALFVSQINKAPKLIGPEQPKNNAPMRTYKVFSPTGEVQTIMTSKTMEELLSEMDKAAFILEKS